MAILHHFGKPLCAVCSKSHRELRSLGAGAIISYIVINLIPKIHSQLGFHFFLGGFVLFFLVETIIYKKVPRHELHHSLQLLHEGFIFIINFIGGAILFGLFEKSFDSALLFFLIFLLVSISEDFSLHSLHGKEKELPQLIVSAAFFLGILSSYLFKLDPDVLSAVLGIAGGSLLFVLTNEAVQKEKERKLLYFMTGVISFVVLNLFVG